MFVFTAIVMVVLAAALVASAAGKLQKIPQVVTMLRSVGVKEPQLPQLAGVELVGALGLIVGLWVGWIGVLAAVGVLIYFVLAAVAHVRVGDNKGAGPAGGLALVSLLVLILRLVTA